MKGPLMPLGPCEPEVEDEAVHQSDILSCLNSFEMVAEEIASSNKPRGRIRHEVT